MHKRNYCADCKASISEDLKYCPLCGKFVLSEDDDSVQENERSFPVVDTSYIAVVRWVKTVRSALVLAGLLAIFVNLLFRTPVFWFPYVLAGLFSLWRVAFYPFKEGKSHLKSLPATGIIISFLLVFIDVYNYYYLNTTLGWALSYALPSVLTLTIIVTFILALCMPSEEENLIKGMFNVGLVGILFFISKLIWFNECKSWPIFMFFISAFTALFVLFIAKKRRLRDKLNQNFHI